MRTGGHVLAIMRPESTQEDQQALRQLQIAVAVAKCIGIAAEYSEGDDIDLADAVAGLLQLMQPATSVLDQSEGRRHE
jgi:hypothetical protein